MSKVPKVIGADAEAAYVSAQKVVEVHRRLSAWLEPGQTLAQIDRFVAQTLAELRCKSCFLGYKPRGFRGPPFPSHACLSLNDCIVHGTAGYHEEPMGVGDVLKIDIGVTHRGWIGDAAWTYVFGDPDDQTRRLCEAGKESLKRGIAELRPGNTFLDWAKAVQGHAEGECGFHLIRGLGGHGYGKKLHEPPFVSNVLPAFFGEWPDSTRRIEAGTLIAVEPMIAVGTRETEQDRGGWPVFTADHSLSVHYEHDILITEDGPRVLTDGLEQIKDVIK